MFRRSSYDLSYDYDYNASFCGGGMAWPVPETPQNFLKSILTAGGWSTICVRGM